MAYNKLPYFLVLIAFTFQPVQNICAQANILPAYPNFQNNFFIENKGQWDRHIKYLARLGGLNTWVTDKEIVFDFYKVERKDSAEKELEFPRHPDTNLMISGQVIRMNFPEIPGIEEKRKFEGKNLLKPYYNYFIGNDSSKWASFVKLYEEVYIENVADGIDMRLYFEHGLIRYDFMINPGSDFQSLKFDIIGSDGIEIDSDGKLVIKTSLGDVNHAGIKGFQTDGIGENIVKCEFHKLSEKTIGFNVEKYNRNEKLIIDPFVYCTYLGGSILDDAYGIDVDKTGNSFLTGNTGSSDYPLTSGAYMSTFYTGGTVFISVLNNDLSALIYSTFLGGSGGNIGTCIKLDKSGNIVVTGITSSSNFTVTPGVYQPVLRGNMDYFICKFNSSGSTLIFSTYLGGTGQDRTSSFLDIDNSNHIWITGTTESNNFPVTAGAFQTTLGGSSDGFISELDSSGRILLGSTYLGGTGNDYANGIALDKYNKIYVCGSSYSTNFPTTGGCYQNFLPYTNSGFISKFNTISSLNYSTYLGCNNGTSNIRDIKADQFGYAYVTGSSRGSNFPTTVNACQHNLNGTENVIAVKLNPAGSALVYSTFIGGASIDQAISISNDTFGNVFITGRAMSANFPVTPNAFQHNLTGTNCTFMTILNNTFSSLIFSTYWGGSGAGVIPRDNFLDNQYSVYYTGMTWSSDFPTTPNAYQKYKNGASGSSNAFVVKMNPVASILYTGKITGSPYCPGDTIHIPFISNYHFWTGNVFFAQLSDTAGNFDKPLNIGFLADTIPGTIIARIPTSAIYSTHYRIRVIGTAPYVCSDNSSDYFTINPSPHVGFDLDSSVSCFDKLKSLSFVNTSTISSGYISSYFWDFGDSSSGYSELDTNHFYKSFGKFKVSLFAVSDSGCMDTAIKYVNEFKKPVALFSVPDSVQCLNRNQFHFTDHSVSWNGSLKYSWQFGDNDSSSMINPVHTYNSFSTSFFTELMIEDSTGCRDTASGNIFILPSPMAGFTALDTILCFNGNEFNLYDTSIISTGKILSRLWDLGDGHVDTAINVVHSYHNNDTFLVSLVVLSDKGCIDTAFKFLYTLKNSSAGFLINDSSQCLDGNYFTFMPDFSFPGDRFRWFFGDGKTDTGKAAIHSFTSSGSYDVKLLVTNSSGCFDSSVKTVVVNPLPVAKFNVADTIQCFKGNTFNFNPQFSAFKYHWEFGDGSSDSVKSCIHVYLLPDTFKVMLKVENIYGCADSSMKLLVVLPSPTAAINIADSVQCLKGNKFDFSALQMALNYRWDLGDGNVDLNKTCSHCYLNADTFTIKLKVENTSGCVDSSMKSVIVLPVPGAAFTVNDSDQCLEGNSFNFGCLQTAYSYWWQFGDGNSGTNKNETHSYPGAGYYPVLLIVSSKDNCTDTSVQNVRIRQNPQTPAVSSNSPLCETETLLLYASCPGTVSYNWSADNGFVSNVQSPVISGARLNDSGNYYVRTIADGCESAIVTTKVIVYPVPEFSLGNDKTLCPGDLIVLDPGIFLSYLWQDGSTARTLNVTKPGIYYVMVSNSNNCKNSDTILVTEKCQTKLYIPDIFTPNNDGINDRFLVFAENVMEFDIFIFNRWGAEIFHSTSLANSWDGTFKGTLCPLGVYYYQVSLRDLDGKVWNEKGTVTIMR